jgi:hypothetical protein
MNKIKTKSEFRNGRHYVSVNCSKPFHKLNMSVPLPTFSKVQCTFKLDSADSVVSLFYLMKWQYNMSLLLHTCLENR